MSPEFGGIQTIRDPRAPSVRVAHVVVESGPDKGRNLRLGETIVRVGTGPTSDLRLSDPMVSRIHCELHARSGGVHVTDSGSTNGTFIGAASVREAEVTNTCTLLLGETLVRIEIGSDSVDLALSPRDAFGPLLGASTAMRRVYALLERVAQTEISVLVTGETGTGKELAARAIHDASARAGGPFVILDCAALPPSLVESELFGHVRGAFTGALGERTGVFEEAKGGTLFIDEVGELPVQLQPKLLRALESRTIRRVGSNETRPIDVRIVAATNRKLAEEVNRGTFRDDLYYRLAVVEARLPPLGERAGDAGLLARHFWDRVASGAKMPASLVSTVTARGWPGNVRELRNFVERAAALREGTSGPAIEDDNLSKALGVSADAVILAGIPFKDARSRWTRAYVSSLLTKTNDNVTHAAQLGGVSRRFLQRLIERAGEADDD